MPLLIAALIGGLVEAMGSMIGRALIALGISFITFVGINTLLQAIITRVQGSFSALPSDILGLVGYLWIDKGVSMVLSAWSAAILLKLAGSDTLTSMVTGAKK